MGAYFASVVAHCIGMCDAVLISPRGNMQNPSYRPTLKQLFSAQLHGGRDSGRSRISTGLLVYDPLDRMDRQSAREVISLLPAIDVLTVPGSGHPSTSRLSKSNLYRSTMDELFSENRRIPELAGVFSRAQ
jgi:hypothetical protein